MKLIIEAHEKEFGEKPEVIATAPGRFHLIGDHSWFFKDKTLSVAVNLPVYLAVSRRKDSVLKFHFHQLDDTKRANLSTMRLKKEDKWANAVKSIIYGYTSLGYTTGGMNVTIYSDIEPSQGFGVTTAIKISCLIALQKVFKIECPEQKLLNVLDIANRVFLKSENYIADNFTCLYSREGTLTITDHAKNTFDNIDIPFEDRKMYLVDLRVPRFSTWKEEILFEPENALILGDLKEDKKRVYGGWQYINSVSDINEELSTVPEYTRRRLICIIREHQDVLDAEKALEKNDFSKFARAVNHSYESLRDYYDLSCPETDWILKRVQELDPKIETKREPVTCGRPTGKGFGRCIYTFLRDEDVPKFKEKLMEFNHIFGFHPDLYEVKSVDGAHIVLGE